VERFNLRNINELEVRRQYQIEITNIFVTSENLINNNDRRGRTFKENMKASDKESIGVHD
jgi:hypothetical protein